MSFSNPFALLLGLLAFPIIVLYFRKVRIKELPVASVMFWEEAFEESSTRALWQKLKNPGSLILQIAILGLIVAAIAYPRRDDADSNRRKVVAVLDCSASMKVSEDTGRRFEIAQEQVRNLIDALNDGDELAILTAGASAEIVCGFTGHRKTLLRHLESVNPSDAGDSLDKAFRLAAQIAESDAIELHVFSDGGFSDSLSPESANLHLIGSVKSNVAITQFEARRIQSDPSGFELLLRIENYSADEKIFAVDLMLGKDLIDVIPVTLAANGKWERVFELSSEYGGILLAQLDVQDALVADNEAVAVLPARRRIPVGLVTNGNWFLQQVLQANPLVDLQVVRTLPELSNVRITVMDKNSEGSIPTGNVVVVNPNRDSALWQLGDVFESPLVGSQLEDHQLLRYVDLSNVILSRTQLLTERSAAERLIESISQVPLFLRFPRESGDVLVLNVSLADGDLPLRTAFPILLSNAISYFEDDFADVKSSFGTSEPIVLDDLKSNIKAGQLLSPDGREVLPVSNATNNLGVLSQTGVWTLQSDEADIPIAVNLKNPSESNLTTRVTARASKSEPLPPSAKPLWKWWVLIALVAIVGEWLLFQRRWVV